MKNGKILSEQLSYLPDELVSETMETPAKQAHQFGVRRVLRAAACLAVILGLLFGIPKFNPETQSPVIGPGLLSVTVSATNAISNQLQTQVLVEGVSIPDNTFLGFTNLYVGIPTQLSVETEDFAFDQISYSLSATAGVYADNVRQGYTSDWFETITCENGSTVRWSLNHDADADWYDNKFDQCYSKIVIYCTNHIIGYAVIRYDRLYTDEWAEIYPEIAPHYAHLDEPVPVDVFVCTLVASVSFPKVDGTYQEVSEAYVNECMDQVCASPAEQ